MPLTTGNPRDLFLNLLADLLFVERQLSFEVIPELTKQVTAPELAGALGDHLEATKRHAETLEGVFRALGAEPSPNRSDPFAGLIEQHSQLQSSILDDTLADVFHATAAAHTEHYEIAAYSTLIALARAMGRAEVASTLEQNLSDEQHALAALEQAIERLSGASIRA